MHPSSSIGGVASVPLSPSKGALASVPVSLNGVDMASLLSVPVKGVWLQYLSVSVE